MLLFSVKYAQLVFKIIIVYLQGGVGYHPSKMVAETFYFNLGRI